MADQLLSDAEVSQPAPKLLSDDEVSKPVEQPRPIYPDDPASTALFQQSGGAGLLNAAQGNWFTRPFKASAEAIKNSFTGGGLSDESVQSLTDAGKLEDYKNQQAEWQHTVNGAITMPSAAVKAAALLPVDYAMRGINALISGGAALGGGFINEAEGALGQGRQTPEAVAREADNFANYIYISAGMNEAGVPVLGMKGPSLKETMTLPAKGEEVAPEIIGTKITNDSGEPLRLYHGTNHAFDEFQHDANANGLQLRGQGFYFTDDPKRAENYIDNRVEGGNIRPVYLDIKNPWEGGPKELEEVTKNLDRPYGKDLTDAIKNMGHDGMVYHDPINNRTEYVAFESSQVRPGFPKQPPAPVLRAPVENPMVDAESGNLNLKYIKTSDDVQGILARSAQAVADRDGVVISNDVTKAKGQALVDQALAESADGIPAELSSRMRGDPTNEAQLYAARLLVTQSGEDVYKLGQIAQKTGDERDYAALEDSYDRLMTLNSIRHDISSTIGRALQSHQIIIKGEEDAQQLTGLDKGGAMRTVMTLPNPQGVAKALQTMKKPGWSDMAIFHYVSWLLSNPVTHAAYAAAGEVQKFVRYGEQAVSVGIGKVQRAAGYGMDTKQWSALQKERESIESRLAAADAGTAKIKASESGQMEIRLKEIKDQQKAGETRMPDELAGRLYGIGHGYVDGIRAAGRSLISGGVQMFPGEEAAAQAAAKKAEDAALEEGKSAEEARKAANAAYSKSSVKISNPIMERAQFINNPLFKGLVGGYGRIVGVAPTVAASIHTFQKFAAYTESIYTLAYRRAALMGEADEAEMGARIAKLTNNPTEDMMKEAAEDGKYASLVNRPGALGRNIEGLAHTNAWTRFVIPFARIATNLTSQSLLERTPVGIFSTVVRDRLLGKNGAVAQSDAIARMAVGTTIVTAGASLAAKGLVTGIGPSKSSERAENYMIGNPALTVRIGDHNYPLRLFGLPGRIVSYGAAAHDVYQGYKEGDDLWDATGHMIHTVADTALQENALKGLSDFLDAVVGHDAEMSKRYALNAVATVIVPRGVAQMTRLEDPYMRSTMGEGFMERLQKTVDAQLPWKSQSLLPQVDVYGRDMLRNVNHEVAMQDPVTQAELRTQQYPTRVQPRINNIKLTDQQYYDYQKKAGAMYYANVSQMVSDSSFADLPIDTQKDMIHTAMKNSRAMARQDMLLNDPNLAESIAEYHRKLIEKRAGE